MGDFFSAMLKHMMHNAQWKISPPVMLEQLVGRGQELPSMPEIYLRVSELLEDDSSSLGQIAETVQNDPAITGRVLKMVNSSYYGLPSQISSVAQAVRLLGRERLRHILIGSVLRGVFLEQDNPAFSMLDFWQHSIKTAIIARELAVNVEQIDEPEAMFTAGLMHDIGRLLLINRFPERMLAAEEYMMRKRVDVLSAELIQMGVTHTAVGEALMHYWGLPPLLVECAGNHHESVHDGRHRYASHLVYLAGQLSQYVPPLDEQETRNILDDIDNWDMVGLSLEQIGNACQQADDMVFEVMESLGMVSLEIGED